MPILPLGSNLPHGNEVTPDSQALLLIRLERHLTLMLRKNPTENRWGSSFTRERFACYAPLLPFPAHTVSMTVLGFMGSRVIRTPMAWLMALAIAAGGGTMFTSPTPRTPNG